MDGHRFDADPGLNFYFAADPDPHWHPNDANLRVEPIVVLAIFEKIELTVLSLHFEMGTDNYFVEFYIKMTLHTSNFFSISETLMHLFPFIERLILKP